MRVAVLLLTLIVCTANALSGTSTQTPMGGDIVTYCDVDAYVIDPDPNGVNVRSGPGSSYKIIGNLPKQDVEGIGVHIRNALSSKARVGSMDHCLASTASAVARSSTYDREREAASSVTCRAAVMVPRCVAVRESGCTSNIKSCAVGPLREHSAPTR